MGSTIVIDVWTVVLERQDELVASISEVVQRLIVPRPGFVSAEIYQSVNGDIVVLNLRMRTVRDRQELTDAADVQQAYRELRAIATSHTHAFRLARSFGTPGVGEAAESD